MARPAVPDLNFAETTSVCSDLDSGIGSCSPTSTGPACVPEHKSVQTFRSTEDYLYAMKEDLAEWLNCLYEQDINVDTFFDKLENGVLLCDHANHVQMLAEEYRDEGKEKIPEKAPVYRKNVKKGTFQARDNIANFITWCKKLGVPDVILFETEDLVMRKNEKSVVLALLEVARRGAKFGMLVPCLIQLEQEIDAEIKGSPPPVKKEQRPMVQMITCDMKSLDEMVRELVSQCTCLPLQFPVIRLAEGKYQVGENKTLIFVRILRNHVMVRVGGGWDTLENYLNKHDPCRCGHKTQSGRKSSMNRSTPDRRLPANKEVKPNVQERGKSPSTNTPVQSRCAVTPECVGQSTRRISTPERPRPSSSNPTPSVTSARRRLSLDSRESTETGKSTPERATRTGSNASTEMTQSNRRSVSKERTPVRSQSKERTFDRSQSKERTLDRSQSKERTPVRSQSKERQAWTPKSTTTATTTNNKQSSPTTPERSLAKSLAGSLSDIRQQSEMLKQQLQEDFDDDTSISSCDNISKLGDSIQMSKSFDFSKLREARRASAPTKETTPSKTTQNTTPKTRDIVRRAQTPNLQSSNAGREQIIQRRSMTPQPSSRVRSTPTTPVARRREVPRAAQTPDRTPIQPARSKTPGGMTSTLKERLNKYKQETQAQQQQRQQQLKQQASRPRRDSEKPVRRDSTPVRSQPGLAGSKYKSPSLSALDTSVELNLDEIVDIGGGEEQYLEMEKMFQQFKKQEIAKAEKMEARASVEAELDRRINGQRSESKENLRDHFNQKRGRGTSASKTAPNTPGAQRRSASAAPSWRENSDQIVRRSVAPKRSKTPEPQRTQQQQHVYDLTDGEDQSEDVVKMCRCCSKLSELLDNTQVVKPRKDDVPTRPKTRIPGPPTSKPELKRTTSLISLASSTDESEASDISKSMDNEVKTINRQAVSSNTRRMSVPADPNRMMGPLITNRSTIIKDPPRAMSPVKALKDTGRSSPIKAFNLSRLQENF